MYLICNLLLLADIIYFNIIINLIYRLITKVICQIQENGRDHSRELKQGKTTGHERKMWIPTPVSHIWSRSRLGSSLTKISGRQVHMVNFISIAIHYSIIRSSPEIQHSQQLRNAVDNLLNRPKIDMTIVLPKRIKIQMCTNWHILNRWLLMRLIKRRAIWSRVHPAKPN